MPPSVPIPVAGGNQLATLSVPFTLDGTGSYDPDAFSIDGYSWTLLYKPPGSAVVLADATTSAPSFTPDVVGTYRIFLVVTTSDSRSSETNPVRADETAFTNVTVLTANNSWLIPARGQKDWDSYLYTILTDLDVLLAPGVLFNCPAGVSVGDAVYVHSSGEARQAQADTVTTTPVIGLVTSKPTTTSCFVVSTGKLLTGLSGLTPGASYYLSDVVAGGLTNTAPATVGFVVQKVGVAKSATELFIQVDIPIVVS